MNGGRTIPSPAGPMHASGGGVTLSLFATLRVGATASQELTAWARDAVADAGLGAHAVRIVDAERQHLTWAYLGDVVEDHVPSVARELERAASSVPGPSACRVVSAGPYASGRVVGMDVDVELLPLLDTARDRFLSAVRTFAPSADHRPWRPHVTVLRATGRDATLAAGLLDELPPAPLVAWIAPELRLYASLPAPGGRAHRLLHAVPFGTAVPSRAGR